MTNVETAFDMTDALPAFAAMDASDPEVAALKLYVASVPPPVKGMVIRDFMARRAFALGQRVDGVRRVRLSEVASFRNLIPSDHPSRIRPLADAPRFDPHRNFSLSNGFLRRITAICEPAGTYPPYPFYCRGRGNHGGMVVAGGCVLTELASTAFVDTDVCRYAEDGGVQRASFRVKGPVSDVDNFIVVPKKAGRTAHMRMCAARSMAQNAVASVDAPRLAPSHAATCMLCHTEVTGDFMQCRRSHVYHAKCALQVPKMRLQLYCEKGLQCACKGCNGEGCSGLLRESSSILVNMSATRSTVNVCMPGGDQREKKTPIWQLTSRVYAQPEHVITSFDLPLSQVLFDGEEVWMTELCALCLANGILLVTPFNMSSTCEFRTYKYLARYGVDLFVPGLTAEKYAAMPPLTMRGIQGLKWIIESVNRHRELSDVWSDFSKHVSRIGKDLAKACSSLGCEVPQSVLAAYSKPYGGDPLSPLESLHERMLDDDGIELPLYMAELPHMEKIRLLLQQNGLTRYQRLRIATSDGNAVDRYTFDLVRILRFHIINPGEQSFSHAHIARAGTKRGLRQVSPLVCMQLWTACVRKLGLFMHM
jgi:hypothetical protein